MNLPSEIRVRLSQDYRFAADQMGKTPDLQQKLFLFSVYYSEAGRALNQHWDDDLALLHLVLQAAHGTVNTRVTSFLTGGDQGAGIPRILPEKLQTIGQELAALMAQDDINQQALYQCLARVATLTYTMTGNGRYLLMKGALRL